MARGKILSFPPTRGSTANTADRSAEALSLLRNFEESCKGWFWSTDKSGNVVYLSDSVSRLLCDQPDALIGTTFAELFAPADESSPVRERLPFILGRQSNFDKLTLQTVNAGDKRWWEVSGCPQFDHAGRFTGYRGYGVDITEQLQSSHTASQLAMYDPLTALPNRLSMSKCLAAGLAAFGQPGKSCAVFLIDLDRFKQVNDSLGHPAGDALLKQVADRLLKIAGDREKVFRLGGDEFQIVLTDCDDRGVLGGIAKEIIASLSQPYSVEGSRCVIGASVGIAIGPFDGRTAEDIMRNADLALYAAKGSGRGCFRFFSGELLQVAEDRRVLEEDLRDALSSGQLSLFYQPIVCTRTNCVKGVEALIRWQHPTRGTISPELFIPIAEEANLINRLGEWIIRKACEDAANWPAEIRVAVNVSPIQFANESLPTIVTSALASSGLAPDRLELELTEGVFLSESFETDSMFATLKEIGVRLALDDFGTGYSSLGYLKTAPFDKIKIDQSFVRGATIAGSRNGAIIAAIVALANALEMETTAEGIESFDQLDLIRSLGVSHVQGYVYSKAVPTEQLMSRLEAGEWVIKPSGPAKQRSDRRSMYRKAGAILGSYYHSVLVRNLSESGALIEGLVDVPLGTQIILDFGDCQLEVATVRRMTKRQYGVEFGQPLVSDGIGGLCTSHRVSPYLLSKAGILPSDHMGESRVWDEANSASVETLADALGLPMPAKAVQMPTKSPFGTVNQQAGPNRHDGEAGLAGGNRLDGVNPLQSLSTLNPGGVTHRQLTSDELVRLKQAVEASHNPQLKHIIALVVLTGARLQDLLVSKWSDVDLDGPVWRFPSSSSSGGSAEIKLSAAALAVIQQLPQWDGCPYVLANPRTRKPYNSFFGSWDAARKKARLGNVSIHDLRNSTTRIW
jgi:diguanylate cyclase (GGDEF)-like protein/PAS domain S-box-containing protein